MKLPRITGDEVVRALKRAGFVIDRQRGSHVILIHPQRRKRVVVSVHAGNSAHIRLISARRASKNEARQYRRK